MFKKKQCGQSRRLKRMKKYLIANTMYFPISENRYEHWHISCREDFLNSHKTSSKIKTEAIQCIIDCTEHLYSIKPSNIGFCHILCIITINHIWDSQIIAFFDAEYYNHFFDRKDTYQKWSQVKVLSMKHQRNLKVAPQFLEKCFMEEIDSDGETFKQLLWVYGELE